MLTDDAEREAFRAQARREGRSLSAWVLDAARERLQASAPAPLRTEADLDRFFADLDRRHGAVPAEDDWEVHRARIERSRLDGLTVDE